MPLIMELNIRLEVVARRTMDHSLLVITMSHVQCVTGAVVMIPAQTTCLSSWTREYSGYLISITASF